MKKIVIFFLIFSIALGGFPPAARGLETGPAKYLDETISAMVEEKQVKGAIAAVVRGGRIELCQGYGMADEAKGIAAQGDNTAFRIGSISKTFVAVAALQLAEKGKLDLHSPVTEYLEPDFPRFKYDISLHDLLTHTAGFEDMISGIAVDDVKKAEPLALAVRKYKPAQVFSPGEVVSYSNYGLALAAYIVERISGQEFYRYAEEHIFAPLGMKQTSFQLDYRGVAIAKGYAPDGKERHEPLINLYPEGSVVSTASDMAKYMQWLMDHSDDVLSVESKSQIFARQFAMSAEFGGMGYTWNRKEYNGEIYYDKKGETANFYSRIALYPQRQTGVFLSFNTFVAEEELDTIMNDTTRMLLGTEQKRSIYTGKQTADISGYYITTRSGFENPEKILNFLLPRRGIKITGSVSRGFIMDGKSLIPIGENYYHTPAGNLKFIQTGKNAYLANNTAVSYVRTNWYERKGIQRFIVGLYIFMSFLMCVRSLYWILRGKKYGFNCCLAQLAIINFAVFIGLCTLAAVGIKNFTLLGMAPYLRMFGVMIMITAVCGMVCTYKLCRQNFSPQMALLAAWNISGTLFSLWMVQVNIL